MWEGLGQNPMANIFASHTIPSMYQLTMFMFLSHSEESFSSSQNLSCGTQDLCKGAGKCTFVQHNHTTTSVCLRKGQQGNGPWSISVQVLNPVHPCCGAGGRGGMVHISSISPADPGTCIICSNAMQSRLNRQVLLTHSRFRGGYVAKMKDYEMKEELVNLSEMKGRQGCVPQAVQGRGDPPLPRGPSLLTAAGKCCRNKSPRDKFRASNY